MALFTKAMAQKLVAGTAVTGMVAFGAISWTGTADLETIKEKFDWVKQQYSNSLQTIENYKTVLGQKVKDIRGYESIQDELNAQITELKRQLADLEANGTEEDKAEITRLQNRVKELEAELATAATEEQYNSIVAECKKLQEQLAKANQEVATLKNYVVKESNIAGHNVISVADIEAGNSTRNPMLTFVEGKGNWTSVDSNKKADLFDVLNGLQILDTFKESPVILHMDNYNNDFIYVGTNSKEAFDRITATNGYTECGFYTVNGKIVSYEQFQQASADTRLQIQFYYINDADWTGTLGYETIDHN